MTTTPPAAVRALLDGPGRWHTLEHHGDVGSTNDLALAAVEEGRAPGLVVVADRQLAGRGRRGTHWEDPRTGASLPMSVTLDAPPVPTLVPLAAGLAVADAIERLGLAVQLKWPNDVLVARTATAPASAPADAPGPDEDMPEPDPRKLVGILTESRTAPHGDVVVVLGIGTNLDLRGAGVDGATSVAEELGGPIDRWSLVADLLRALDRRLASLDAGRGEEVLAAYRRRCVTLGRPVTATVAGTPVAGEAVGITGAGGLLVRVGHDEVREVTAGQVAHVRPDAGTRGDPG